MQYILIHYEAVNVWKLKEKDKENAEISTPINAPKVTSIRVETYGIDYGMPETLTPFDYTSWMYKQYGIDPSSLNAQ